MLNSRNIEHLRPDVAANCRVFLDLCAAQGLKVLVTNTVRDDEYQAYLYAQGRTRPGNIVTNAKRPSFHSDKAGLAFDICKNVKGQEYSDTEFFKTCAAIGKAMGFEWGGDWKGFVDMPHFQWSGYNHEYASSDIWVGRYPPDMPLYKKEETNMNFEQALEILKAKGITNSPDYWAKVGDCVMYFKDLMIKIAKAMK